MSFGKSSLGVLLTLVTPTLGGCLGEGARPPQGQLQVSVAPLQLEGITDAEYTIVVTNAPDGAGEVVWQQTITSDRYGDGSGSITYIGTCDADAGTHTVTLTLDSLTDANGTVDPTTYVNPTPVSLEPTCVENADVPVLFDITLMRSADQGFFDVSVQFEDIFCSAKLDCQNPDTSDLDLLFNGLNRDMTVVLGFACTGGLGGDTYLYMDDLVIDCTNSVTDVRVEPTGLGVVAPTSNPNGYLFGAAIYRGVEDNGIMYWNAALGLNAAAFGAMGNCTLKTRATASSTPWPQMPGGFPLPEATVYPVIEWDVQLTSATQRVCTQHEVNGGNGVATNYLGYLPLGNGFTWANAIIYMRHRLAELLGGATQVLSAGAPICNPSCAHGGCVDPGTGPVCDCAGTGYDGPTCAVPVCTSACQNGGDCVAPNTCDCTGTGYGGPTCEADVDECQTANGGCSLDATCTNTVGGLTCECDPGFYGDGVTCTACPAGEVQPLAGQLTCDACDAGTYDDGDEVCATCATCDPGRETLSACTSTTNTACGLCPAGYSGDGVSCTACPDGQVQPLAGSASCDVCPVGTYDDGTETCATCSTCNAGQYVATACGTTTNTVCGLCPAGTSGDGVSCTNCPAGQVQPTAGSASCITCAAGTYDDGDELCGTCATCSAGTYETGACTATTNRTCGACTSVSLCTGSVTCTSAINSVCSQCATGYQQLSAGAACTDIDECAANTDNCDANATCTNTTGGFTCACNPGYSGSGTSCVAAYSSCVDALDSGETVSQTYVVDPDGAGPIAAHTVYCDMTTDGGGWTLMAKFSQHQSVHLMPQATYDAYFGSTGGALWIEGNAMAAPSTPTPSYDTYHVESLDWRKHLVSGQRYQLRQHFFKGTGTQTYDVKYGFVHNGHVKQDGVSPVSNRVWPLQKRKVLSDATGITWTTDPTTYFWLPFSNAGLDGTNLYTGCNGYGLEAGGCTASNGTVRRFGNAGIIDPTGAATDPAAAWAPHANASSPFDWVYVHQAAGTYGTTGAQMTLLYWAREVECVTDAECPSGACLEDGTCAAQATSCMALRESGVTTSGVYTLDRDGAGPAAAVQAYCDMTTDGGGWMYVGESGRSATNTADTYIASGGDYHRFIYDLRGFTFDQVLVVRPSGYYWCNSWGSDSTYWGPGASTSMGIATDTSTFNYHNGQFSPYAWIQVPYGQSTSCSSCWMANNTAPSLVSIASLDGATGSIVKLDPPGSQLAQLEISNFDAFITQAGGCNLSGANKATWRAFVRAAPSGDFAQLQGPAQTFAASTWTAATFNSAPIASGVSVSGTNLTFSKTGVYRITLSYRPGNAGDVWTAVRLYGNGATQGVSAGHGNHNTYSPDLQTVELLASVPNTATTYQIQVGRDASAMPVITPAAIAEINLPAVQATVERITDLTTPSRPHVQLEGAAQVFAANAWTAATWSATPRAHQISASGANLTFAQTGVYRVTLSYRHGPGGDVWTAAGLFGDGALKGISAGYGNLTNSTEVFTTSFLANVDNTAATYQLRLGRLTSSTSVIDTVAIGGQAVPAVQATIVRETGVATSYAQLQGAAQTFPANAWTAATFNASPLSSNITYSGSSITINEPGIYRVTLSYRQGTGGDVWTAVRLVGNGVTAGLSAGYGNTTDSPELFTASFLASVIQAGTYKIEVGRLAGPVTVVAPSAIVGITPPAVQATLVKVR